MESLGEVTLHTISLFGLDISYNPITFIMTYFVALLILFFAIRVRFNLKVIPGFAQSMFELIYDFLKDITLGTLGDQDGKKHLPFIVTLFIFILVSNWIGIIPNLFKIFGSFLAFIVSFFDSSIVLAFNSLLNIELIVPSSSWLSPFLNAPGIEEPTRSVNTDLALALLVFFIVQIY